MNVQRHTATRPRGSELVFGRYLLLDPLAKGGMAEIWRAKLIGAAKFERPVVIKRILPHLYDDPAFVRRFIAEAKLSARLHHPNIVQVFELGECNGELFMAIEEVVGADVRALIAAVGGPLPSAFCALVAHEICRALAYAYSVTDERGRPLAIVHRDVTPSNVMIGYDGQVRLVDFGIAKALGAASEQRSRTGNFVGKMGYVAPEIFDGAPYDHQSDLFAVGVLLHEMLTGRRLFRGEDDVQTLVRVRTSRVPPPSEINPLVPRALERITMRSLERSPARRYLHADEMAADLASLLHELRWTPQESAELLARVLPKRSDSAAEPSRETALATVPTAAATATTAAIAPARRRRAGTLTGAAVLIAMLAFAICGLRLRANRVAPTPPAVPPTIAPAPSAPAPAIAQTISTGPASRAQRPPPQPHKKPKRRRSFNLERGDVLDAL